MYRSVHRRSCRNSNRVYVGLLASALGAIGTGLVGVAFAAPATAQGDEIKIEQNKPFIENFGNGNYRSILQLATKNEWGATSNSGTVYGLAAGESGETYSASNYWANTGHCNGMIVSYDTAYDYTDCNVAGNDQFNSENHEVRIKAAALGLLAAGEQSGNYVGKWGYIPTDYTNGWPIKTASDKPLPANIAENRALSTNSTAAQGERIGGWNGAGAPPWNISNSAQVAQKGTYATADQVMIASNVAIRPESGSAFLELMVNYAATRCVDKATIDGKLGGLDPNPVLKFQWLDGPPSDPNAKVVSESDGVDVCGVGGVSINRTAAATCSVAPRLSPLSGHAQQYVIDGMPVRAVTVPSPLAHLFTAEQANKGLYFRVLNVSDVQNGNDGAIDNVKITVATPTIHKSFTSDKIVAGQRTQVEFTIKNSDDWGEKSGWSVSDTLPPGLHLVIDPDTDKLNPDSITTDCGTPTPPLPPMEILPGTTGDGRDTITIVNGTIHEGEPGECHIWVTVVADEDAPVGQQFNNCIVAEGGDDGYLGDNNGILFPDENECASTTVVPPEPIEFAPPMLPPSIPGNLKPKPLWPAPVVIAPGFTLPQVCTDDGGIMVATADGGQYCFNPLPPTDPSIDVPKVCTDEGGIVEVVEGVQVCFHPLPPVDPGIDLPKVCTDQGGVVEVNDDGEQVCYIPLDPAEPGIDLPQVCTDAGGVIEVSDDGGQVCFVPLPPTEPGYNDPKVCVEDLGGELRAISDDGSTQVCFIPLEPADPGIDRPQVCIDAGGVMMAAAQGDEQSCFVPIPPAKPGVDDPRVCLDLGGIMVTKADNTQACFVPEPPIDPGTNLPQICPDLGGKWGIRADGAWVCFPALPPVSPSNPLKPVTPIPVEPNDPLVPARPKPIDPNICNPPVSKISTPPAESTPPPEVPRHPATGIEVQWILGALGLALGGLVVIQTRARVTPKARCKVN